MGERLLSQLAHVEILTPVPDQSLAFYTDVLGLEVSGQEGQSVFLRGWGEWFHHSIQLTEAPQLGLGHIGWRAEGTEQLTKAVERLQASGLAEGWHDGDQGHGDSFRYRSPVGQHLNEIFWDVTRYVPPPDKAALLPNRPQRYQPRGAAARSLDHVTVASPDIMADVNWYKDTLGHRFTEYIVAEEMQDLVVFAMTSTCHLAHDMALVLDHSGANQRVNHVAFWVDQREELLRVAEVFLDADVPIEFGPGRHGMGEQDYLYVREPSGLRIELNAGGYRNFAPDWEPVRWLPSEGSNSIYRNIAMPETMMESFPPVGELAEAQGSSGLFNS
ncbi:MAG TPA: VOC family protein [Solirubrobacteraceae bacterium]|jgi:catechol 2,3-dioxygenase|nr:VOC family protein [Solirubrobacteraceae bacterium]